MQHAQSGLFLPVFMKILRGSDIMNSLFDTSKFLLLSHRRFEFGNSIQFLFTIPITSYTPQENIDRFLCDGF
jgi:hypothetical protein